MVCCKLNPCCGFVKLRTAVLIFGIVGLSINSLGLAGSIFGLTSHNEICIRVGDHLPRCLKVNFQPAWLETQELLSRFVIDVMTWVVFSTMLIQFLTYLFLVIGAAFERKCLVMPWLAIQTINIVAACFVYGYWLGYTFHAFAGDLVVVAYSTAALVAVVGLDIYFWFLVVAFYKENNQTQQQI